mmetsp:Transcript_107011/g.345281  ORF Transcript_107011/g.345281 Transcript_107011/m.345281 type:complete len:644 (-) Transcript_107011:48-1979(-)
MFTSGFDKARMGHHQFLFGGAVDASSDESRDCSPSASVGARGSTSAQRICCDGLTPPPSKSWDAYVTTTETNLRADLSGANLCNADLKSFTAHLDALLEWRARCGLSECNMTIDLSCNFGISDAGIAAYLTPFLRKWPTCRRLKLYQTSIGDQALQALSEWIASGYAYELHLSDLGGPVTGSTVFGLFLEIHRKGKYPCSLSNSQHCALWLRLEHNGIQHVDQLVAGAQVHGLSVRILCKTDLYRIRPGCSFVKRQEAPAVNLVLFRSQRRKKLVHDNSTASNAAPSEPDSGTLETLRVSSAAVAAPASPSATAAGREILAMIGGRRAADGAGPSQLEPQAFSEDEFRLWEMEVREALEIGADARNAETFGEEDAARGWSFEENLAANERLAGGAWSSLPRCSPQPGSPRTAALGALRAKQALPGGAEQASPAARPVVKRFSKARAQARGEARGEASAAPALGPTQRPSPGSEEPETRYAADAQAAEPSSGSPPDPRSVLLRLLHDAPSPRREWAPCGEEPPSAALSSPCLRSLLAAGPLPHETLGSAPASKALGLARGPEDPVASVQARSASPQSRAAEPSKAGKAGSGPGEGGLEAPLAAATGLLPLLERAGGSRPAASSRWTPAREQLASPLPDGMTWHL